MSVAQALQVGGEVSKPRKISAASYRERDELEIARDLQRDLLPIGQIMCWFQSAK